MADLYIGNTGKLRKPKSKKKAKPKLYPDKIDLRSGHESVRKLDTKRMSKALRARYTAEARRDDPNELVRPLSPYLLDQETKSALNLKYGGQERQLNDQLGASAAQQARIGSWYDDYKRQIQASEQRVAQANAEAQQTLAGNAQRSTEADAANRQQIAAQQAQSAAMRGATTDPAAELKAAQAAAARRSTSDSQMALQTSQGTNARNFLIDRERIAEMAKVGAHEQESSRERAVRQALQALEGEKGDYALQYRAQARQNERQNLATLEALGINKEKAERDERLADSLISDRKADNKRQSKKDKRDARLKKLDLKVKKKTATRKERLEWAKLNETSRHHRETEAAARARAAKSGSKGSGPTSTQRRRYRDQFDRAYTLASRKLAQPGGWGQSKQGGKPTEAQMRAALVAEERIPAWIAQGAVQKAIYGGVGSATARKLRAKYGIKERTMKKKG